MVWEEKGRNYDLTVLYGLKKWEKIIIWTYNFFNLRQSYSPGSWFWTLLGVEVCASDLTSTINILLSRISSDKNKKNPIFLAIGYIKYYPFPFRSSSKCSWIHWVVANSMKIWSRISSWRALCITILVLLCTLNIHNLIAGQETQIVRVWTEAQNCSFRTCNGLVDSQGGAGRGISFLYRFCNLCWQHC